MACDYFISVEVLFRWRDYCQRQLRQISLEDVRETGPDNGPVNQVPLGPEIGVIKHKAVSVEIVIAG
jgi:hypothetical protein